MKKKPWKLYRALATIFSVIIGFAVLLLFASTSPGGAMVGIILLVIIVGALPKALNKSVDDAERSELEKTLQAQLSDEDSRKTDYYSEAYHALFGRMQAMLQELEQRAERLSETESRAFRDDFMTGASNVAKQVGGVMKKIAKITLISVATGIEPMYLDSGVSEDERIQRRNESYLRQNVMRLSYDTLKILNEGMSQLMAWMQENPLVFIQLMEKMDQQEAEARKTEAEPEGAVSFARLLDVLENSDLSILRSTIEKAGIRCSIYAPNGEKAPPLTKAMTLSLLLFKYFDISEQKDCVYRQMAMMARGVYIDIPMDFLGEVRKIIENGENGTFRMDDALTEKQNPPEAVS